MNADDEKKLAKELHAARHDPGEWEEEPDAIEVRPTGSQVVSFRMPTAEFLALQKELEESGESLSQYIRAAVMEKATRAQRATSMSVSAKLVESFMVMPNLSISFTTAENTVSVEPRQIPA